MKIEKLVDASTALEETLDELDEQGLTVYYVKARVQQDNSPEVDIVVTADHDVYAVRVGKPI